MEESLLPGQVISGRFRLEHLLGHGGMGAVWEAYHLTLETPIAIKFLDPMLSRRREIRWRFAREATAAAKVRSPHVVTILDYGFTDDERCFIAMELLKGEDLGRRLARLGGLTPAETVDVVAQVCRGLAKAHAAGIVHRDLKPENLFVLEEDGEILIKILDFGIAKAVEPGPSTHKTDTGQLLGTPVYMSPEQALGRVVDSRSDLYSLAVVAYRCLAGRPPFLSHAVGELIVAVTTRLPPPPSSFNASLPAAIDTWFEAMLAKDPNERPCQTATEFADGFARICTGIEADRPGGGYVGQRLNRHGSTVPVLGSSAAPLASQEIAPTLAVAEQCAPQPSAPEQQPRRERWRGRGKTALVVLGVAAITAAAAQRWRDSLTRERRLTVSGVKPQAGSDSKLANTGDSSTLPANPSDRAAASVSAAPSHSVRPGPAHTASSAAGRIKTATAASPLTRVARSAAAESAPIGTAARRSAAMESRATNRDDDGGSASAVTPSNSAAAASAQVDGAPTRQPPLTIDRGSPW